MWDLVPPLGMEPGPSFIRSMESGPPDHQGIPTVTSFPRTICSEKPLEVGSEGWGGETRIPGKLGQGWNPDKTELCRQVHSSHELGTGEPKVDFSRNMEPKSRKAERSVPH